MSFRCKCTKQVRFAGETENLSGSDAAKRRLAEETC
jgi:hypothetical protein